MSILSRGARLSPAISRRIRRTPYTSRAISSGASEFTVVNHTLLPKAYRKTVAEDYWHLKTRVQIWDVGCQRQVEIAGPDASRLVQWMTPRDISAARIGDCLYLPVIDRDAGMVNDPILLKLEEDRYWLSIADSDLLLFALGLAQASDMNVRVAEPDVSPLAIQGPMSSEVASAVFGDSVRGLERFKFGAFEFRGTSQIVARTGYSSQDGFEVFLDRGSLGEMLWDAVFEAGRPLGIAPGCPNLIDRIEAGLISYGNEVTRENNPLEAGLGRFCSLDRDIRCLGMPALHILARRGIRRRIRGIVFGRGAMPPSDGSLEVFAADADDRRVGTIASAAYSPRLERNVGLAMMEKPFWEAGESVVVRTGDGQFEHGEISELPIK